MSDGHDGLQLDRLLELQAVDTEIDQCRHRRDHASERQDLAGVRRAIDELAGPRREFEQQRRQLADTQAELERQVEAAGQRATQIDARMRSGQVTAARDLTAMDDELHHLRSHVSGLEDRILEVMEALEPIDRELAALEAQAAELSARRATLEAAVAELDRAADEELAALAERRAALAAAIPEQLRTRYEDIRARTGGVGAARLVGSTCSGCHLELPSMEVDRIRKAPEGALITCEQCGRILVR